MDALPSYPKIRSPEKRRHERIFDDPIVVQEKLDGSQFSFGVSDDGELLARSKNTRRDIHAPDSMFGPAIEYLKTVVGSLPGGVTFRAETLATPSHNILNYDDTPRNHVALFGAETEDGTFLPPDELEHYAGVLDVDAVPLLHHGPAPHGSWKENWEWVEGFLDRESYLGGPRIEGVVVKNYHRPAEWAPFLAAKVVRDDFKERQGESPAATNHKTILEDLKEEFGSEDVKQARWQKVVQHAREDGGLEGEMSDLGRLIPDLQRDLYAESEDVVKEAFWEWAKGGLFARVKSGFPEWYKAKLRDGEI